MPKRSYPSSNKWAKRARVAVRAASTAYRAYSSLALSYKKKSSPETGVTANYDKTTQYRRKRMPRWKKKRWVSFVKKVTAVGKQSLGTNTVLFNQTLSGAVPFTGQLLLAAALYGYTGTADQSNCVGMRDQLICINKDARNQGGALGAFNVGRVTFYSGVIDMTMRNTGSQPLEVDVYKLTFNTDNAISGDFVSTFNSANDMTSVIPGSNGTSLSTTSRGATLFDFPQAISADKMKVWSKRKYFLPAGNTATLQHRDPRNYVVNPANVNYYEGAGASYCARGKTIVFAFIAKTVTGAPADGAIQIGVTRKYTYSVEQANQPFDAYNPSL